MTRDEVVNFIQQTNGKIFSIRFIKRTTKELREMVCRTGVTSHLTPVPTRRPVNFQLNRLIPVFEMKSESYKSIPIEGIQAIKIEGEWVEIDR